MGGGEVNWIAPQIKEENKAMEVDPEHVAVPATSPATVAATAPPAAPQVDEENNDEDNEGQEFLHKGKKSYIWQHFTGLPLAETKGQHKTKCNHCCKIYSCHPTKHGTNSLNKHLKADHKWIFTKVRKKGHFMVICLKC
ncbi:hypothetical protein HN51_007855 [Arachis hypogaea]